MRWLPLIAGSVIVTVVGGGCILSKDTKTAANGLVFANLPASTASSPSATEIEEQVEKMQSGDEIVINFTQPGAPDLNFVGSIRDDGTVTLLSNKVFTAAGKTMREFEKEVSKHYGPELFPITVTDPAPIIILGEVKAPGKRPLSGALTVLKAIESAGGFTERASQRGVKLIRADGRQIIVNCVEARRESQLDVQVYPSDRIIVPGRLW
jgi:polysaccharide export outer membrane protein